MGGRWIWLCLLLLVVAATAQGNQTHRLFVANSRCNAVTVYALAAQGDEAPLRMIFGNLTELETPQSLAADEKELWVGNLGSVAVFGLNDTGNRKPRRLIRGPKTGISLARGLALKGSELFVACARPDCIRVFPADASGDVKPLRVIQGAGSQLANPGGLTIQSNLLWVANEGGNQLLAFSLNARGGAAPERVLTRDTFRLYNPRGVAAAEDGRLVLTGDGGILEVVRNNSVSRRLSSAELSGSAGVAEHAGEIFVANNSANTTVVFGPEGEQAVRVLRGPKTRLRGPSALLVAPCH